MNLYWVVLLLAVIVEIAWAMSLKWIQINPGVLSIGSSLVLTGLNMLMLSYAMRGTPVGTSSAIWNGLSSVGFTPLALVFSQSRATATPHHLSSRDVGGMRCMVTANAV